MRIGCVVSDAKGQAARRFRHPNAVTVYDLRTSADGTIYMVMEYVEGHTLDAELKKRGSFTARDAFEILTPIMSVLDTAHSMGVVHRDLKPENIMIGNPSGNGGPVVKLLDLGIAKMREIAGVDSGGNTALTMAGQVLGTPYYMSPEQWGEIPRDENLEIDGRADIYSLGLVFYELILGRRCYSGNTLNELRREHVSATPKPLHEVVTSVPIGFSNAIQKATAKDRADRQPTTAVLASELKAGLETAAQGGFTPGVGELAQTISTVSDLQTNSDVNAPTVIGLDASATAVPSNVSSSTAAPKVETPKPIIAADPNMSGATLVESADMASSVTIQQQPKVTAPPLPNVTPVHVAPASKSKAGLMIGLFVLLVVLVGGGVGGFFIYKKLKPKQVTETTSSGTTTPPLTPTEVTRYWLMVEPPNENEKPARVAGLVPVASGQKFQMRFVFAESGYVYIIGPNEQNKPTVFLSTKPSTGTGLKTNEVKAGKEFSFPNGDGLLGLDNKPGTDKFTVVFSKTRLESPSFTTAEGTGEALSSSQLAEFKDFVAKYTAKSPIIELDDTNNQMQFVRVKVNADQLGNPIVFEVRIQHN
jgi:serine/threonine protein kinase